MIYAPNQASYNAQAQVRPIQLLNKQGSFIQAQQQSQKQIIYRPQSGQSTGSLLFQQGAQMPEVNQQQHFPKSHHVIQHQQTPSATFFANQNQVLTRSINGGQQQLLNQQNNNTKLPNNAQGIVQNGFQSQQQNKQVIKMQVGEVVSTNQQKNEVQYQNMSNSHQQMNQPTMNSTQLQPINRQGSLQIQNTGSVYFINSQSSSSQNLGQLERESQTQQQQPESLRKVHSTSFHERTDQQVFLQSSPLKLSAVQQLNGVQNMQLSDSALKKSNHAHSAASITNQAFSPQPLTQQEFLLKQYIISQQTPQANQQGQIDFQKIQNQSQPQYYQTFLPISTSSPAQRNNDLRFSQQLGSNPLSNSLYQQQNSMQLDSSNHQNYIKQIDTFSQYDVVRDNSPYDKLIRAKRSARGEYNTQNKTLQSYRVHTHQIDTIQEENVMTPKKLITLNSNEMSQRSDLKGIDTTDTDIRERVYSLQKQQITQTDTNLINSMYKNTEICQYDYKYSPKLKLNIKEKIYGNHDMCNYYPVSHIRLEDLQRYDLNIKSTLQSQNQSFINQKIRDFSEGFQFSAQ